MKNEDDELTWWQSGLVFLVGALAILGLFLVVVPFVGMVIDSMVVTEEELSQQLCRQEVRGYVRTYCAQ